MNTSPDEAPVHGDGHAGDLVSARLDGELDDATAVWVDDHLASCGSCQQLAEAVEAARAWMRSSPSVDSAPMVESVIARRRRLIGNGLTFVGVVLLVLGLLAVTASVSHPPVVPEIDALVAVHEASAHASMSGVRLVDGGGSRYTAPAMVGAAAAPLRREAIYDGPDLTSVVYVGSGGSVTVYEQPGRVDWDELPAGTDAHIASRRAWERPGSPAVVVTEIGDLAVTIVADDRLRVEEIIESLEAPRRTSTADRVHDSCQRLMEIFALGG